MSDVECAAPVSRLSDPDMQAAPVALLRAAQRARELAARTGTPLILFEKGQVVQKRVTDPGNGSPPLG